MINQVKTGDKLTIIKVNSFSITTISEIQIHSIVNDRIIFAVKRTKYYLNTDCETIVLKGHNLGISQEYSIHGRNTIIADSNYNLSGLDRQTIINLLKTNINPLFCQWHKIHWYDGISNEADPIFLA